MHWDETEDGERSWLTDNASPMGPGPVRTLGGFAPRPQNVRETIYAEILTRARAVGYGEPGRAEGEAYRARCRGRLLELAGPNARAEFERLGCDRERRKAYRHWERSRKGTILQATAALIHEWYASAPRFSEALRLQDEACASAWFAGKIDEFLEGKLTGTDLKRLCGHGPTQNEGKHRRVHTHMADAPRREENAI